MNRFLSVLGRTLLDHADFLQFLGSHVARSYLPKNREYEENKVQASRFVLGRAGRRGKQPKGPGHVGSGSDIPPVFKEAVVSTFSIQEHAAKRANLHYDLRIIVGDKAYSWASRKPMAKGLFLQPVHTAAYALWEGEIKEGYGAGSVKVWDKGQAVLQTSKNGNLHVSLYGSKVRGTWALVRTGKDYLCVPKKHETLETIPANEYTTKIPDEVWKDPKYIAELKLDGSNFSAKVTKDGMVFTSRRLSVDGAVIDKTDNVPHLSTLALPKGYRDAVIQGELAFVRDKAGIPISSYETTSGILNSLPPRAIQTQAKLGKLTFFPFEVIKAPDLARGAPYGERRAWLDGFVKAADSPWIRLPEGRTSEKLSWYKRIVSTQAKVAGTQRVGEGVVLKDLTADRRTDPFKWFKMKATDTHDLWISGFTEGTGRLAGKGIGALLVSDKTGREVGKVGSGLTDQDRLDAFQHPRKYLGHVVEVRAMAVTATGSLRAPRLFRWRPDKTREQCDTLRADQIGPSNRSIPAEQRLLETLAAQNPDLSGQVLKSKLYAYKSAAGWRSGSK